MATYEYKQYVEGHKVFLVDAESKEEADLIVRNMQYPDGERLTEDSFEVSRQEVLEFQSEW